MDPASIQVRHMEVSGISRRFLMAIASVLQRLDGLEPLPSTQPIDVARGLVGIYEGLRPWVKRTSRLRRLRSQ